MHVGILCCYFRLIDCLHLQEDYCPMWCNFWPLSLDANKKINWNRAKNILVFKGDIYFPVLPYLLFHPNPLSIHYAKRGTVEQSWRPSAHSPCTDSAMFSALCIYREVRKDFLSPSSYILIPGEGYALARVIWSSALPGQDVWYTVRSIPTPTAVYSVDTHSILPQCPCWGLSHNSQVISGSTAAVILE